MTVHVNVILLTFPASCAWQANAHSVMSEACRQTKSHIPVHNRYVSVSCKVN